MYREKLIEIFAGTRERSQTEFHEEIERSLENTIILEDDLSSGPLQTRDMKVEVTEGSSVDTASRFAGKKTALLNFANAYSPGGGVEHGARAQEEVLCRCSTLYEILSSEKCWNAYYRKNRNERKIYGSDRIIYSPGIMFFNTDRYEFPEPIEPFQADVITCAAPDLYDVGCQDDQLEKILHHRYRNIFLLARDKKVEVLILGAIGCGAFRNDPDVVSGVMADLCREFPCFERVIFPIFRSERLYEAFKRGLSELI